MKPSSRPHPGRNVGGSIALEAALFIPLLFILLLGMVEIARITYTYFLLQRAMYSIARYVGTQQAVNFCDTEDPSILAAKNLALTGTVDGTGETFLPNLDAGMIQIRIERYSSFTSEIGECECSIEGCDASQGGGPPDYVVVSIPDGYEVRPVIPRVAVDAILLKPRIRVPYGGT